MNRHGAPSHARIDAREIAARVLTRVLRDAAYAAASLDAELDKHTQLQPRDRALCTELVYGTLRCQRALLAQLGRHASKGLPEDDLAFMVPLLIGAYQVLLLDRVPAFAAVDAAVTQISRKRGKGLGGFANALLRKLRRGELAVDAAIYASVPEWLRVQLEVTLGEEQARALVGVRVDGSFETAAVGLRLSPGASLPEALAAAEPSALIDRSYRMRQLGDPRKLDAFARGEFSVQEEGAQMIAAALGARPGERIWDTCAGRGQKTTLIAERTAGGELWASDLYAAKLDALLREASRLHLPAPHTRALDLSRGAGDVPGDFDRVLVDAPCSGTGTLRRRPEILLKLGPEDPARLAELAERILRTAAAQAREGGRVVFAVCSVLPVECEAVVQRVSDVLQPLAFDSEEVQRAFGRETTAFRLLPGVHGTDGYFAASLCKIGAT